MMLATCLLLAACSRGGSQALPALDVAADAPAPAVPVAPPAKADPEARMPYEHWDERVARLPSDAALLLDRVSTCAHFAGELDGTPDAHDRDIGRTMRELHCDTLEHDVAAGRARWHDNPDVMAMLDEASGP